MGEQTHQQLRAEFAGQEKDQGDHAAPAQHHIEQTPDRIPVSLAPVLGAEYRTCGSDRHQKHVRDKLDLRRQGYCRHLILCHPAQHQGIARRHRCEHQALERNRQRQFFQFLIESAVVDLHWFDPPLTNIKYAAD